MELGQGLRDYAQAVKDGKSLAAGTIPHLVRGGLKEGFVKCSDYGRGRERRRQEGRRRREGKIYGWHHGDLQGTRSKTIPEKRSIPEGKEYEATGYSSLESMG